jgi:hypothetical protein
VLRVVVMTNINMLSMLFSFEGPALFSLSARAVGMGPER